jgi:hypothetical protein
LLYIPNLHNPYIIHHHFCRNRYFLCDHQKSCLLLPLR